MFCDPAFFEKTQHKQVGKLEREQRELAEKVAELTERWDELEEELSRVPSGEA